MSYTKSKIEDWKEFERTCLIIEIRSWEEFEQACLMSGIDAESFCDTDDLFEEFEKYKKWRAKKG